MGLALLLDANLLTYRALAKESRWPEIGEPAPKGAKPARRLLGAVGLHFMGDGRAEAEYIRITRVRDSSMATVAALLLSILYRDLDRTDDAIRLLRNRIVRVSAALEETLTRIHLGVRFAENGDWASAVSETERAVAPARERKRVESVDWLDQFEAVAEHNLFQFSWRQGVVRADPLSLRLRSAYQSLVRPDLLLAKGLEKYLEAQFDAALADPYSQTISFQAEDQTERQLQGALLRSDWLGDWSDTNRMRKLLGRYQVIARLGTRQSVPPSALELLRRAGDEKGIRAASRTIARMGPLGSLQQASAALLARSTFADEPASSMVLLAEGADIMSEEEADRGITRLLESEGLLVSAWHEAPRALAELVKVASADKQKETASFVREILTGEANAGLVQSLQHVVEAIRWSEVDEIERRLWLELIDRGFMTGTDLHVPATRAVLALAPVEGSEIQSLLVRRFRERPRLELVALMMDAFGKVLPSHEESAFTLVFGALEKIREEAARGQYGFGLIDVGALSVALIRLRPRRQSAWRELLDFLLDPAVNGSAKIRPLDYLASGMVRIPTAIQRHLRQELPKLKAADSFGVTADEAFEGAKIRVAARLEALEREQLLARLLEFSTAPSGRARIEAARSLPNAQNVIGFDVATMLALTLARDAHHDVRSAAARALPQLRASEEDGALALMKRARLSDLLSDPGTVVPFGAVAGLLEAQGAGLATELFRDEVRRLGRHHPSHLVREVAESFCELHENEVS